MDQRSFLSSNSWKNIGRILLIIVGIILIGYGFSRFETGKLNIRGTADFFIAIFGIYWKLLLIVLSPFILSWFFKKISPPEYHKAADTIAFIVLLLILFGFVIQIEYNFYRQRQYESMIVSVLFFVLFGTIRYFQKEQKGPA